MNLYHKDNPESIQAMFDNIAPKYDRTNDILSLGLNRYWNHQLLRKVIGTKHPAVLLDICCGTGDITFTYLKKAKHTCHAFLLDFSENMLRCAQEKARAFNIHDPHKLTFLKADAQEIPLPAGCIDTVVAAYGIRNVKDSFTCFKEVFRVLRPGGSFGILELTRPTQKWMRIPYLFYLNSILPRIGKWTTSNGDAYQYLCDSIQAFIDPEKLQKNLTDAGFIRTHRHSLFGGIATILVGTKQS
jgi:demethylmenaquinone methyltransferase/2-methoxy-6-polyprenyl-1,4-benzoquinol methylase